MNLNNKVSSILNKQIPSYLSELYANDSGEVVFVLFLKAYYEYLEQQGHDQYLIQNSKEFFDIDSVFFNENLEAFRDYFFKQFLPGIPKNVLVDKKLLLKHGREFYLNKGNDNSFKFLFKILFNEEIQIFIPNTKVLTVSDSSKGLISEDCKIHDSFFWQQFSYQISSQTTINEYKEIVTKLLHPAGMKLFGKFLTEIEVTSMVSNHTEFFLTFFMYVYGLFTSVEVVLTKKLERSGDTFGDTFATLEDLININAGYNQLYGYASSAYEASNTTTEIFLKVIGLNYIDGYLDGWHIAFIDGLGAGQVAEILTWENNTTHIKVTTVTTLSTAADKTSEFKLFRETPGLIGVAQAGASNTITLSADEYALDDFYNNLYTITIDSGTGSGQTKQITDYNGTTKVATVVSNWSVNPNATSVYLIKKYDGNETGYWNSYSEDSINNVGYLTIQQYTDSVSLKKKKNLAEVELFFYK